MILILSAETLLRLAMENPHASAALWTVVGCCFILGELSSPGLFFFISFALGCFAAAGTSFINPSSSFETQALTALGVCLVSFFILSRSLRGKKEDALHAATNFDALIHQSAVVTKLIMPDAPGRVKIRGEEWVAESSHPFPVGTHVKISAIRGNRLIIK